MEMEDLTNSDAVTCCLSSMANSSIVDFETVTTDDNDGRLKETCDASQVYCDKKSNPIATTATTNTTVSIDKEVNAADNVARQTDGSNRCLQSETLDGKFAVENDAAHGNGAGNLIDVFDTNYDKRSLLLSSTIFCPNDKLANSSPQTNKNECNSFQLNKQQQQQVLLQEVATKSPNVIDSSNAAIEHGAERYPNQIIGTLSKDPTSAQAFSQDGVDQADSSHLWSCSIVNNNNNNNLSHLDNGNRADNGGADNDTLKHRYGQLDQSATRSNKKKNEAVIDSATISSSISPIDKKEKVAALLNGQQAFDGAITAMESFDDGVDSTIVNQLSNNKRPQQPISRLNILTDNRAAQANQKLTKKACNQHPEVSAIDHPSLVVESNASSNFQLQPPTSIEKIADNKICFMSGNDEDPSNLCNFSQIMSFNVISEAAIDDQHQHQDICCLCDSPQWSNSYQYSDGLNVNRCLIDETCHSCHRPRQANPTTSQLTCFNQIHAVNQQSPQTLQPSQLETIAPKLESCQNKFLQQPHYHHQSPLNSLGPLRFMEKYRERNSSQRPLVSSFSSETNSSRLNNKSPNNNKRNSSGDQCSDLGSTSWFSSTASSFTNSDLSYTEDFSGESTTPDLLYPPHSHKSPPVMAGTKSCKSDLNGNDSTGKEALPERGQWSGQLDFIFSCISYAVGLGNVWRFPYLCYENGGGAFLVPYLICVVLLGIPLFLMEVSLGQYLQSGGVAVWNRIPLMKGVGFASMVMIGLCNTYYIVIIAWTLYYLFRTMESPLPWSHCGNPWNSDACHQSIGNWTGSEHTVSPAQEFWERKVLNISGDLSEVGSVQWPLLITLIVGWLLVYGVIYRGIHQSGKIIWFTAMFPYVLLVILFGFGISLSGASDGIWFYITPKWHMLTEAKIWVAAGTQLLFTYGIGIGTNVALGSYNKFNHNFYRDSIIACMLSSATSLFSGFVIFSVLGHMATSMNTTVAEVARSGPGLAFIVYPEAVSKLPIPNLWAILFFVMLLVLGIDSQFCTVESFITGIVDEYPRLLRPRRKMFTFMVVCVHCLLGISMITSGGMYIFQLMDNFSASGISLLIVVLMEVIGFAWIYGGERIYRNMIEMLGFRPNRILYYVWVYVSPSCLFAILLFSIVQNKPPEYAGKPFPWYGELCGWIISMASILCIPIYVVYFMLFKTNHKISIKERFMNGLSGDLDENDNNSSNNSNTNNNNNNNNNDNDICGKSLKFADIENNGHILALPPSPSLPPPIYPGSVTIHPNPTNVKLARNHRQQSEVSSCSESTMSTSVTDRSSMA